MTDFSRYDRLFSPKSIAVVGASDNPASVGSVVFRNLKHDFPGRLVAVNPKRATVEGMPAMPSLEHVDGPVDLVIVIAPAEGVPAVVKQAIARGDGALLVISSGFAEVGPDGQRLQAEITALAAANGLPILGPNCIGFMNAHEKVMANFSMGPTEGRPVAGPVALVSQSGGFGSYILIKALQARVKVGLFASTGNEADVTVAGVLRYFVERPDVEVILTFCEATRDPEYLLEAATRAKELGKVIVALKTGDSEAAARAALSHTASIVGAERVFNAVCDQYGIIRVSSIEEMVDIGLVLQTGRRMAGPRLGVVTSSGGAGVLIADAANKVGLDVPELPEKDRRAVAENIPAFGSALNPVDHTGRPVGLAPDYYERILRALLASDVIDAVIPIIWRGESPQAEAAQLLHHEQSKPILPVVTWDADRLSEQGLPVFTDPVRAVRAVGALARASGVLATPTAGQTAKVDPARRATARALLRNTTGKPFALETVAKDVLGLYGLPVVRELVVSTAAEAAAAATELGGAVVLKVLSYDLPHKSDVGGVRVGMRGAEATSTAFDQMATDLRRAAPDAVIEGYVVQQAVPADIEIMCGLERDPVFGPIVAIGVGGTLVEIVGDPVLLRAPFSLEQASVAVDSIAGGRITHPKRGLTAEQRKSLAAIAVGIGQLAVELPEVVSIDVNPMRVSSEGMTAVDALMVLDDGAGSEG